MLSKKREAQVEEAIFGAIGVLMVVVFLGFLAIDIGSGSLLMVTAVVLAMAVTDLVQSVRRAAEGNGRE